MSGFTLTNPQREAIDLLGRRVQERAALRDVAAREFSKDPRVVPADDACRRWLYTACTRAQTSLFVVDERWTKY